MWSQVKLHFKYLVTKTNIIFLIILGIILCITLFFSSGIIVSYDEKWLNMNNYRIGYIDFVKSIYKIVLPLISVFFFGNSFTEYNDNYLLLFHSSRNIRINFFLTKVLSIIIVIACIIIFSLLLFFIIGKISFSYFDYKSLNIKFWFELFFICLIYGFFSISIVILTNHSLGYIINFSVYILINALQDLGENNNIIWCFLLPTISQFQVIENYIYLSFTLICHFLCSFILYYFKNR